MGEAKVRGTRAERLKKARKRKPKTIVRIRERPKIPTLDVFINPECAVVLPDDLKEIARIAEEKL